MSRPMNVSWDDEDEAEYQRGVRETKEAQQAGPPDSEEREAAYREMEQRWYDEGFDG